MDKFWFNDLEEFAHVIVGMGYTGKLDLDTDTNIDSETRTILI